ncbi:MAG: deoxyguanosinetriphosphate triphosphohydrolase [Chloroflexi bacterium]|jgi:dGTPase|nr:deoxyguanosinetriphosphate triphosphohydrolase [Anaerolineaceae bacterium]NLI44121.1 deoxyguanosinetriphosphate triphosphohydrolase [Chloroflexota bacterium]HOE34638.1 deoxyguanosinetriphosphate triphosphohydrolase [Anaerolineaceae bacterium]HOT24838.1 deoxyguanosinetriphosphate triphosphohydrolase [Anaerolineaceae bacterium]HQH57607.1 deoxyguanosinetriphosphate triphosphohydrolase [Anaerolineaceae bacterium]
MIYTRQQLEEYENQTLAPYAVHSKDSKGRVYPEEEADFRTRFQRDRERVLHTTAFRRLEYKTQVFINHEGDYYRTRLTHSLEVAQIGRSVARSLGANEDLVETICLAHDLGHPPFGHSGEAALARLMRDYGGFNHNQQSVRIVTTLENRYPDYPGLNLSWEVVEGMVKHETDYDIADAKDYSPELRGHLEAQIANVADELAYTSHDLDDGLRSGMITPTQLDGIAIWEIVNESIGRRKTETLDELSRHQIIRRLISFEVTDLIQSIDRYLRKSNVKSSLDVQKLPYNVVGFSEDMYRRNRELKDFLFNNLYRHYRVVRMSAKAEKIITELFGIYQKTPTTLPASIQELVPERGLERTICDYIAGMTDRFAIDEYKRLFDADVLP